MCNSFYCFSCQKQFVNHCKKVAFDSSEQCPSMEFGMNFATCKPCYTVNSAIDALNNLVSNIPFLLTEGLSGLDGVSGWEKQSIQDQLIKSKPSKSWEDEAESRKERHAMSTKLERMGLKDLEDLSAEHQGFNMAVTPDSEGSDMQG